MRALDKISRESKRSDFVQVSREPYRDKQMSLKARGLLITILSLPDDWNFSVKGLCSVTKESRESVMGAIRELTDLGYCRIEEGEISEFCIAEYPKYAGQTIAMEEAPIAVKNTPCAPKKREIELPFKSDEFRKVWGMLMQEKKWKTKSAHALELSLRKLQAMTEEEAICSIEAAIERGWQGLFQPSAKDIEERRKNKAAASPQRKMSIDEIMARHYGK